jgi:DNA-binding transcriptional LysR family regulator
LFPLFFTQYAHFLIPLFNIQLREHPNNTGSSLKTGLYCVLDNLNMFKLTLKQCAYFVAVAEQDGIAQASRVLYISQPAVAQALDKLEHVFGFRLFERHHARGTELTPQGRAFLRSARDLLRQAERTEHDAVAIAADIAGIVRLGCFHTIAPFYLAQIVGAHREVYPDVEIVSSELRQDEIISGLDTGEIDLALTYDMSLDHCPVERQVVAQLKPFLLLNEHHPRASQASIRLADMAQEPFVMFDGPSSRDFFENILAAHGINPPVAFNSKSMESVRSAVSNGLGFSLSVMRLDHSDTYDGGRVVSVPIVDDINPLAIVLVRKQGAVQSRQIDKFSSFCEEYFKNTVKTNSMLLT